ncbi:acyl-CoA dehydrogenase family protein [Chloroflexota bacterium]
MEFGFSEEQEKLRKEVKEFFLDGLPEDCKPHVGALSEELHSFWKQLQKKAGEKGYLTPGWPKEYSGSGMGVVEQGIVDEEQAYAGVVWPASLALRLMGPGLIHFGTEEQKKEFVPPIARGEQVWFEAFTEPDAGSDESNQQTRAVEDGDDYIINGQKVFITGGYEPDWLCTEVRTADVVPKHRGLSVFMIPADAPGVTIRPLPTMSFRLQNEIFFDDVRVPKKNMLGQLNRGFYHVMEMFGFERGGTGAPALARRNLREFVQFCKKEKRNGKPLMDDPDVRLILAQMVVENEVHWLLGWHSQWWRGEWEKRGPKPYDLTSFFTKKFVTRHAGVMSEIMGSYGQLKKNSKHAKKVGPVLDVEGEWQYVRSLHAEGTFEINKLVLASRGLGLPRVPAKFNKQIMESLQEKDS